MELNTFEKRFSKNFIGNTTMFDYVIITNNY